MPKRFKSGDRVQITGLDHPFAGYFGDIVDPLKGHRYYKVAIAIYAPLVRRYAGIQSFTFTMQVTVKACYLEEVND